MVTFNGTLSISNVATQSHLRQPGMVNQFVSEHRLPPSGNDAEVTRRGHVFTGYNVVAIPLAVAALDAWGVMLSPALGAALVVPSTVIVATSATAEPEEMTLRA